MAAAAYRLWSGATLLTLLLLPAAPADARQNATGGQADRSAVDLERDGVEAATVTIGGEPVTSITAGAGTLTPEFRARRIERRALAMIRNPAITDLTVAVTEVEGSYELRVGSQLLMVVTPQDAQSLGVGRAALADQYAHDFEVAMRAERHRYEPATLIASTVYAGVATVALVIVVWAVLRVLRFARLKVGWLETSRPLRLGQAELVTSEQLRSLLDKIVVAIRAVLLLIAVNVYLTFVLGLFPWTRGASLQLLDYLVTPIRTAGSAFIHYLPKLIFVIVIAAIIYTAVRLVGLFFARVKQGRVVLTNFPPEWADPTNRIVRVLLIAFGLIVAFPYLPASDSAAFAGVSVFMGILLSLSSSSAISNVIAGVVLTYTGGFRVGDYVKIGDAVGDITDMSLLATHMRTIKNEHIAIPNSIALGSSMTNYCRTGTTPGLILYTTVTIGYNAPWRQVHDLLISAALATPGLRHEPPPFVWQTALNDFYIAYEINAYTDAPHDMMATYAALHSRIQDAFNAAGVEIMSPHYTSIRDGNTIAIPEANRAPGYRAPAFRVGDINDLVSRS